MRVFEDEIFTEENIVSKKYVRAYLGFLDPEAKLHSDGSFMGKDAFDIKKWMSTYPDSSLLSDMNLPGSFASLSGSLETLYTDYKAIPFLFQTQTASSTLSA